MKAGEGGETGRKSGRGETVRRANTVSQQNVGEGKEISSDQQHIKWTGSKYQTEAGCGVWGEGGGGRGRDGVNESLLMKMRCLLV